MDVSMLFPSVQRLQLSQALPEKKSTAEQIGAGLADVFGVGEDPQIDEEVITFDLTTSENYEYASDVTSEVVDSGSTITDHIRNEPGIFQFEGKIVDYPISAGLFGGVASTVKGIIKAFGDSDSRTAHAYKMLKLLRDSKKEFNLITPLDVIPNCVLQRFSVNRTAETEGSLPVSLSITEIKKATARYGMRGGLDVGPSISGAGGTAPRGVGVSAATKAASSAAGAGAAVDPKENLGILEGIFGLNPFGS